MTLIEIWKKRFGKKAPRFECHLREIHELAGVTTQELADHCLVSVETIELIENAKYEPSVVLAEHIASQLNTTVESLFTAHPPIPAIFSDWEERIQFQLGKIGLWCFYGLLAVSLIGANILIFVNEEEAGLALGAMWVLGSITILIGASRIPGYWQFSRQTMRATLSKRLFWYQVIGSPILFATAMTLMSSNIHSWQKGILSFLFSAVFFGGFNYWLLYRKLKPKK